MSTFEQVKLTDAAGLTINPRKEDGHGSARGSASWTQRSEEVTRSAANVITDFLAADEERTGVWVPIPHSGSVEIIYAASQDMDTVEVQWSDDGVNQNTGTLNAQTALPMLTREPTSGYYSWYAHLNRTQGRYARIHLINGPVAQAVLPNITDFLVHEHLARPDSVPTETELSGLNAAPMQQALLRGRKPNNQTDIANISPSRDIITVDGRVRSTQSGSRFFEGFRADYDYKFSRDSGAAAVAELVNVGGVGAGGTVTHLGGSVGVAEFATDGSAGDICYFETPIAINYESGHTMRGETTGDLDTVPAGDWKLEYGIGEDDGAGGILNGFGKGEDATGTYVFRIRGGAYAMKVYQADWNRFKHIADPLSPFFTTNADGSTTSHTRDATKNNISLVELEWFGAAPPSFWEMAAYGEFKPIHIEETAGRIEGNTVPEPNLKGFVRIQGDSVTGAAPTFRVGSMRGGIYTSNTIIEGEDDIMPGVYNRGLVTSSGSQLVAQGARISQVLGRSHNVVRIVGATANGIQYTPPAGKVFQVHAITWAIQNTNTGSTARARLRDGGAAGPVEFSLYTDAATAGLGGVPKAASGSASYPEPLEITTDVYLDMVSGTNTIDVVLIGYLEDV